MDYPGGQAKGLKDFWDFMTRNPGAKYEEAIKNSAIYELVKDRRFTKVASSPTISKDKVEFYLVKQ